MLLQMLRIATKNALSISKRMKSIKRIEITNTSQLSYWNYGIARPYMKFAMLPTIKINTMKREPQKCQIWF